jgi:DNA primase
VCDKGGNAITLVQEFHHCTFVDACVWLGQNFGIYIEQQPKTKRRVVLVRKTHIVDDEKRPFSSKIAQTIIIESKLTASGKQFLLNERKYSPEVINQLRIVSIEKSDDIIKKLQTEYNDDELLESGFCKRTNGKIYLSFFTPCLIYPYYDERNCIVGIQSRYLGKKGDAPRFQFVSRQKTRVYNLPIINRMQAGDDLYISEGVTDCLALLSSGKNAVAIPSATILPKDDLYKLRYYRLHMYPDRDEAGKKAFEALQEFFINHYTTIKMEVLPEGVKDYSDYYQRLNR